MNQHYVPDNLPECFALIEQETDAQSIERLRQCRHVDLTVNEHFGWGLFLRNRFIHPRDSPIRDKIAALPCMTGDDDGCGGVLLEALWLHVTGNPGPEALLHLLQANHESLLQAIQETAKPGEEQETEELLATVREERPALADVLPLFSPDINEPGSQVIW